MEITPIRNQKFFGQFVLTFLLCICVISVSVAQEKSAASLYNEGLGLLKSKDYSGGLVLMEEALAKAGPEDEKVAGLAKKNGAIAAYNAAGSLRKSGALDEALALYKKGIEMNPMNSSNYEGVARTLEAQGSINEAVVAYLNAANKGAEEGKKGKKVSRQKKAETIVGKLFVGKEYDKAVAAGEAYVGVDNNNAEVHYYISRSHAESGNAEKALIHASKAVELSGETTPDKYYYAQATQFENTGKNAEAIAAYKMIKGKKYKAQADYKIAELGG